MHECVRGIKCLQFVKAAVDENEINKKQQNQPTALVLHGTGVRLHCIRNRNCKYVNENYANG